MMDHEAPPLDSVQANGLEFAYHRLGDEDAPLALCLHGFPDTPHTWLADVGPALVGAGYRVVAPYTRGYGPSEAPADGAYGGLALSADVLALIDALGGGAPAVVVAHDWGAYAAHLAVAREPEKVRAFVAIDVPNPGALRPSLGGLWQLRHFIGFQLRGWAVRWMTRDDHKNIATLWRRWSPGWAFSEQDLAPARACFARPGTVEAALGYYWSFKDDAWGARAKALRPLKKAPTTTPRLTITGSEGPGELADYERAERYHQGEHALLVVEGAGHFTHREAPEAVCGAIVDFLGEHAPAR